MMENNDSVTFIAKINNITPIVGADKIELAQIQGWTSIVQKDIHKVGDLILCITTDAVIPEELAIKWGVINYLRKGNRVRTVKLKGVYSECVLIPLKDVDFEPDYILGEDLMNELSIFKYEPPVVEETLPGGKKVRFSQNPNFHIYYKFPNQKNTPNMFNENDDVAITRKIHGINARYGIVKKSKITFWDKIKKLFGNKLAYYEFVYGSHNVQKAPDSKGYYNTNVWYDIFDKYNIKSRNIGYKLNISHDNIINERAIICACYKWEDEDKVHSLVWNNGDDGELIYRLYDVLMEADEIIGHNGDAYDVKWFRTRCLYHGILNMPDFKTIDTLKLSRKTFRFNSNKLDYIGQFLGLGKKIDTGGFGLWKDIIANNNPESLSKMVNYCKQDVLLLEKVHNKLEGYSKPKTHIGLLTGNGRCSCPKCASNNYKLSKTRISAAGLEKKQLQCNNCGSYYTVSKTVYDGK